MNKNKKWLNYILLNCVKEKLIQLDKKSPDFKWVQKTGTLIVQARLGLFYKAYLYSMPDGTCVQVIKFPFVKPTTSTYPSVENFIANCWQSIRADVALLHALKENIEYEDDEVALRND